MCIAEFLKQMKEAEEVQPAISESDDEEKIQTEARILSEQIRSLQQEKYVLSSSISVHHNVHRISDF